MRSLRWLGRRGPRFGERAIGARQCGARACPQARRDGRAGCAGAAAIPSARSGVPSGSTIVCIASSAGSVSGWSARTWAPRLSSRASAQAAISRASGWGSSSSGSRPSRVRRSPASRHSAVARRRVDAAPRAIDARSRGSRPARRGSVERRARRARAEHEALAQRVGGQPVGPVQAGAGRLADRVEAGQRRAAVEVGGDPAHHVVGGRSDGDQLARRRRCPASASALDDVREAAPGRPRACRARPSARRCARAARRSPARPRRAARAPRRSARRRRRAGRAPSPRIASVTRNPSRPATPITAVGWNWRNSRSASCAPARVREQHARCRATPAGSSCAPTAPPRRRRRSTTARARERARPSSQASADAAAVGERAARRRARARAPRSAAPAPRAPRAGARRAGRSRCRRSARRGAASGRPRARARARRRGRRRSARRAARGRATRAGASAQSTSAAERRTSPRPARSVSARWRSRAVVGGQRGGEPALRPVARRLRRAWSPRSARRSRRPPRRRARRRDRRRPRRPPRARPRSRRRLTFAGTVQRWPPASSSATRRRCATTPARHPERAERIVAIERHLDATGWFGFERREAPRRRARAARALPRRPATSPRSSGFCAAGGGQIDDDTLVSEGSWEAALRAAGGAVAVVDALLAGEAVDGVRGRATARPPRDCAAARWASACSTTSRSRRSTRSTAHGLERVLILDWDVHHGNGTNDLFHASAAGPLRVDPRVAAVSRQRAGRATAAAAPATGFTLNLPVPAGSGDEVFCELVRRPRRFRARASTGRS